MPALALSSHLRSMPTVSPSAMQNLMPPMDSVAPSTVSLGDERRSRVEHLERVVVDVLGVVERGLKVDTPSVLHAVEAGSLSADQGEAAEIVVVFERVFTDAAVPPVGWVEVAAVPLTEAVVGAGAAQSR